MAWVTQRGQVPMANSDRDLNAPRKSGGEKGSARSADATAVPKGKSARPDTRAVRLAEELRANLRKRKSLARARGAERGSESESGSS